MESSLALASWILLYASTDGEVWVISSGGRDDSVKLTVRCTSWDSRGGMSSS